MDGLVDLDIELLSSEVEQDNLNDLFAQSGESATPLKVEAFTGKSNTEIGSFDDLYMDMILEQAAEGLDNITIDTTADKPTFIIDNIIVTGTLPTGTSSDLGWEWDQWSDAYDDFDDYDNGGGESDDDEEEDDEEIPPTTISIPQPTPPGGDPTIGYGTLLPQDFDLTQSDPIFEILLASLGSNGTLSGGGSSPVTEHLDCDELGHVDYFRDLYGNYDIEVGAMLINNDTGGVDFYRGQAYTNNSSYYVDHAYSLADGPNITAIIHNHPDQGGNIDLENRYPSGTDWLAAETLVANGANPNVLTLYIVAPDGTVRGFDYTDRTLFENLTARQQQRGVSLPDEISDFADAEPCVTI